MVTIPTIKDSVATFSNGVNVLSLVENIGTKGYIQFITNTRDSPSPTPWAYASTKNQCIISTPNIYIQQLYDYIYVPSSVGLVNYALISAYNCVAANDCSTTCSSYNTSVVASELSIPTVNYSVGLTPNPITNLTLTPGNTKLTVNFTEPVNPSPFAYGITLYQGTTKLAGGYKTLHSFDISNLQNGVLYTVNIYPITDDNYIGTTVTKTGTPAAQCTQPTCSFNIT